MADGRAVKQVGARRGPLGSCEGIPRIHWACNRDQGRAWWAAGSTASHLGCCSASPEPSFRPSSAVAAGAIQGLFRRGWVDLGFHTALHRGAGNRDPLAVFLGGLADPVSRCWCPSSSCCFAFSSCSPWYVAGGVGPGARGIPAGRNFLIQSWQRRAHSRLQCRDHMFSVNLLPRANANGGDHDVFCRFHPRPR